MAYVSRVPLDVALEEMSDQLHDARDVIAALIVSMISDQEGLSTEAALDLLRKLGKSGIARAVAHRLKANEAKENL